MNGRLAGLIDINHGKNYQFIRSPVDPTTPATFPRAPSPISAESPMSRMRTTAVLSRSQRREPDVFDPVNNTNITIYHFNTANPLAGDAVAENATGP